MIGVYKAIYVLPMPGTEVARVPGFPMHVCFKSISIWPHVFRWCGRVDVPAM